ncbi:MAG: hypothetical protein ACYS26_01670 [Planctomycetota bacterium]|jgi:hypothetical protein
MLARHLPGVALFLAAAPWSQAEVRTVGPDDQLYDFTSIQAALDASQDGDLIRVAPGDYEPFLIVDKAVSVLGSGSDLTRIQAQTLPSVEGPRWMTSIYAWGVDAGPIAIGGFTVEPGIEGTFEGCYGVYLDDSTQAIQLFDIEVTVDRPIVAKKHSRLGVFTQSGAANCSFSDCHTRYVGDIAPWAMETPEDFKGVAGFALDGGEAWLSGCTLEGSRGPQCGDSSHSILLFPVDPAGPGIQQYSGDLTLADCVLIGADGNPEGPCDPGLAAPGFLRTAEIWDDGATRIHDGPNNRIQGGSAPYAPAAAMFYSAPVEPELSAFVKLIPGIDESGLIAYESLFFTEEAPVIHADHRPVLAVQPAIVELGSQVDVQVHADPNAVSLVFWSGQPLAAPSLATPSLAGVDGTLLLSPLAAHLLPILVHDGKGTGVLTADLPFEPTLLEVWITLQAFEVDATGITATPAVAFATR